MFHKPAPCHRLFFAIRPPRPCARQIASATCWFGADGQAMAAERLHITSFILDDRRAVSDELLGRLRTVGGALRLAPFDLTLDRVVGSRRSIALRPGGRNAGLAGLHRRLAELARGASLAERADYRFSPHLTLGYRDGEPFQQRIAPIGWRADELVLIHSYLGRTRHEVVGRWPLCGDEDAGGQLSLW